MSEAAPKAPSPARLLAAGQRGEIIQISPIYGPCCVANIPGKGRGLIANANIEAGGLLLCEPCLASGSNYGEVANALRRLVEAPEEDAVSDPSNAEITPSSAFIRELGDGALLAQLLSLSAWGDEPTNVPEVAQAEAEDFLKRGPPATNPDAFAEAQRRLVSIISEEPSTDEVSLDPAAFYALLEEHLERVVKGNAFRSAVDPLGAIAWHSLAPKEQRTLASAIPGHLPTARLWFFLRASLFNHSDTPNATWLIAGGAIMVRASAPIKDGDEICFSYWPDVDPTDAKALGLYQGFGITAEPAGDGSEPGHAEEQATALANLKRLPLDVAALLADAGSASDIAALFDHASTMLATELGQAEAAIPKHSPAFLEPRFFQAQLNLQQAALLTAKGDAARGEELRRLGLVRARAALNGYNLPWGKRALLRLLYGLKATLRPAPVELLGVDAEGDFAVQLSQQARMSADELRAELEKAVDAVFGDAALLPAVLSKCGLQPP